MDTKQLIDTASKAEWTLECDRKVLELMQNLASKIESRATNTKGKMNTMILSLDETKLKMSNLTRIHDIKNTVYCENLITDDHLEPINEVPKTTVKLSTNIAIQNGLKLMENCFERHRVNLDPSNSRPEITTVYRPIDPFYTPLPYLIGEKNWKEKWHIGLIEEDKYSQTGSAYAESVESNITANSRVESENLLASESNLMASQTSLSKSNSSIGDQMVINKQGGLFDEVYTSEQITPTITQPATTSTFFAPQQSERKIVNLFDNEPPELTVESSHNRKPANLFDDIDSVISMPITEPEIMENPIPQAVDLFNDNEFDNFIRKIENNQQNNKNQTETSKKDEIVKEEKKATPQMNMQRDMKNIAAEIKNVQLKKAESVKHTDSTVTKTVQLPQPEKKVVEQQLNSNKNEIKTEQPKAQEIKPQVIIEPEPKALSNVKTRQKITNLFDDDEDESEDFFDEIIKQRSQSSDSKLSLPKKEDPIMHKNTTETRKTVNLFDDEDDDDFNKIFNKNPSINVSTPRTDNSTLNTKESEERDMQIGYQTLISTSQNAQNVNEKTSSNDKPHMINKVIVNKRQKKLFDDYEENDKANKKFEAHSENLTSDKTGQESENIIGEERESEQKMGSHLSTITKQVMDLTKSDEFIVESLDRIIPPKYDKDEKTEIRPPINEENLFKAIKTDKVITANCQDNDNVVPNVENENRKKKMSNQRNKEEYVTRSDVDIEQSNEFNNPILFLSDQPPDDDEYWDTEDNNFEEPDDRETFNQNTSNYLAFNEIPPDDDFISQPKSVRKDSQNDEISTNLFENDPQDDLLIPKSGSESVKPTVPSKNHKLEIESDKTQDFESKVNIREKENQFLDPKVNRKKSIAELLDDKEQNIQNIIKTLPETENVKNDSSLRNNSQSAKEIIQSSKIQETLKNFNAASKSDPQSSTLLPAKDDQSPGKGNIKSKLDLFTKPQEQPATQESPPKKLPGKLNKIGKLAINVNALMPGAKIPKIAKVQSQDSSDSFDNIPSTEELDSSSSSTEKSLSIGEKSTVTVTENISNSGLLNNDLTKLRAKIQVKRRPSTRKGRKTIYEKTLSEYNDGTQENENDEKTYIDNDSKANLKTKQTNDIMQSNLLSNQEFTKNIFPTSKAENKIADLSENIKQSEEIASKSNTNPQINVKSNFLDLFDDNPPPLETTARVGSEKKTKTATHVTSKIHVFYDDEDETRKMLEEEKKKKELNVIEKSTLSQNINTNENNQKSLDSTNKAKNPLFDDDSDNDLFPASKIVEKPKKIEIVKPKETPKSLFNDDDEDEDDLFGSTKKKVSKKSTKLFDDDENNKLEGSIIFSKSISSNKPKKTSIFGDDEYDDDDDLFSSKPKTSENTSSVAKLTPSTSKSTPSSIVKKSTSAVVNDPLKDLMGN